MLIVLIIRFLMFQVCSIGVMQDRLYVSEHPTGSHVDAFSVYCTSCGNWLGWRIVTIYVFHQLIHFLFDIYMLIWQHDCPPCNPWRPICTCGMWWWCRHRGCISNVNFSIDFYSVKKSSNVVMSMIVNIIAIITTSCWNI